MPNIRLICTIWFITLITFATLPLITSSFQHDISFGSLNEDELMYIGTSADPIQLTTLTQSSSLSNVELSWTSRDDYARRIFVPPVATGDHVVLHVDAYDQLIETSLLDFTPTFSVTGTLVIASEGYNPYFDFDIRPDEGELSWFSFDGLQRGWIVTIVGLFSNSDSDFMAWTGNPDYMSYADNILGSSMTTTSNPEGVSFVWDFESQDLLVACYNGDDSEGWVEINIFTDVTADKSASGDYISFDTYNFLENMTVPLLYLGLADGILLTAVFHPGLTFNNFFAPKITQFPPNDLGNNEFNFTWMSSDRNQDDENYYSVWLSSDGGHSYQMIGGNLTETFFLWDSTGFFERDNYLVKIRAHSLDFTFPDLCTVDYPPMSYWPGDYSDSESFEISAGDVHSNPPGYYEVRIDSPEDINYTEHSTGNLVIWNPSFYYNIPFSIDYEVYQNNSLWMTARYHPYSDQTLEINVDGLQPGTHEFKLQFGSSVSDAVIVRVISAITPYSPWSQLIQYGTIGVSVGSSFIILIVVVLTIRVKREHAAKLVKQTSFGSPATLIYWSGRED